MALYALRTTNVPVPFDRLRKMWLTTPMQEGVAGATDLKVSQRAAGANMSFDMAPGAFWIQTNIDTPDGLVPGYSDAIQNITVTASHATLPRIDSLYIQYNDSSIGAGVGGDTPTPRLLAGTPTTGAQATNFAGANYRAGAAAAPNDALLIADILVPAASTTVTTANIVDRRPWARGAYNRIIRTTANYTTASTVIADVDATNLKPRIECSGVPLRLSLRAAVAHTVNGGAYTLLFAQDDVQLESSAAALWQYTASSSGGNTLYNLQWETVPAAGSHLFAPRFAVVTAGTLTVTSSATIPLIFTIEEIVRPNASNS